MTNYSCGLASTFPNATALGIMTGDYCEASVSYAVADDCCTTSAVRNVSESGMAEGCIRVYEPEICNSF